MLSADNLRNSLSDLIHTFGTNNFTGEKLARIAFACEKFAAEIDEAGLLLDEAFVLQIKAETETEPRPFTSAHNALSVLQTRLDILATKLNGLNDLKQGFNKQ